MQKFGMAFGVCTVLLLAASIGFVSGLQFPEWCVRPSTLHVGQNERCTSFEFAAKTDAIVLSVMRGEEENAQVLLDLHNWPSNLNMTTNLSVTFTDLSLENDGKKYNMGKNKLTSIPRSTMQWWQVGYVYCKHTTKYTDSGGGWRPDPLLNPSSSNDIQLETGVTTPVWVSLRVPYGTAPGTYRGIMTLTISGQEPEVDTVTKQVPVEATVWDIDLPQLKDAKFPAIFSFCAGAIHPVYGTAYEQVKQKFYSLFLEQRVGGSCLYISKPTNIKDATFLARGGATWLNLVDVADVAGLDSSCSNFKDTMVQKVLDVLTPTVAEYKSKGLLENMFVYGFDEVHKSCEQSIRKIFGTIKERWPSLRTVAALNWYGGLPTDLPLDVWVIQYHHFDPSTAAVWTRSGKQQWWYHCIVPNQPQYLNTFIERPLMETRLLFWYACSHNVGGWLYYSTVKWRSRPICTEPVSRIDGTSRTNFDPANYIWTDSFANGDGNFVYPGEDGPVPSARLHNLRDGFEDAELLHMLNAEEAKKLVEPLVQSPTRFSLDSKLLEQQRNRAAFLVSFERRELSDSS